MIRTVRRHAAALSLAAAMPWLCGSLAAQQVLLHEVRAEGGERWIELHNRSAAAVDLSTWSLHHATLTTGMPQTYWWGFPSGTTMAPGAFLRVHWYQPVPSNQVPGELHTGNTPYHFLFGLGGEPLGAQSGALGLLRSRQSVQMNNPAMLEDWVSFGAHGHLHEALAVQAGLWTAGHHAPAIAPGHSLARNTAAVGQVGRADLEWFLDATPTPSAPNTSGMHVASYGQACAAAGHHLLGVPQLRTTSLPLLGNAQFAYAVDHTTGVFGEMLAFAWSASAAPSGLTSLLPPLPGQACREAIDPRFLLATALLPTTAVLTEVPLPLDGLSPAMAGLELHAQGVVLDLLPNAWPPYQGITNALQVVLGQ